MAVFDGRLDRAVFGEVYALARPRMSMARTVNAKAAAALSYPREERYRECT